MAACLDPAAAGYCERCGFPRAGACPPDRGCRGTSEVWALTEEYVAIRDIKMCGCAVPFVHGLAMPRIPVRGSEDPARPSAIWAFAWEAARTRIAPESEIALAVNPPGLRTQDHLHVHLVRLKPDARSRLGAGVTVERLDAVWDAAARHAAAAGLADYGVLVARAPGGGFLVLAHARSPEDDFTVALCPG